MKIYTRSGDEGDKTNDSLLELQIGLESMECLNGVFLNSWRERQGLCN